MKEVNVDVKKILEIVKDNKDKHNIIYQAALEGYWKKAGKLLRQKLRDISKHKHIEVFLDLPFPENHEKDYDRIIKMLELSTDSIVTLDQNSFSQIVLNDWSWKESFKFTNSGYIGFTGPSGSGGVSGRSGGVSGTPDLKDTFDKF
jgi:hypothetical protein